MTKAYGTRHRTLLISYIPFICLIRYKKQNCVKRTVKYTYAVVFIVLCQKLIRNAVQEF